MDRERSPCRTCTHTVTDTRLKITSGSFRRSMVTAARCAACGGQYNWRDPNRVLLLQNCADPSEAHVFRAHHLRARARISRVFPNCWPMYMLVETT